jgi:hypothetical protein
LQLLHIVEQAVDLSGNTRDLDQLVVRIVEVREKHGVVSLVVIDTVARVMAGTDENSGRDMGGFIAAARRIEDAAGGVVVAIHHSGKDTTRGARGHSSLRAAADAEIEVTRDDSGIRTAKITKLRDGEDGATFAFRLECVPLGPDGDRKSCVLAQTDETPRPQQRERRLGADETIALDTLKEEAAATGEVMPGTSALPAGKRGVKVENWRVRFYARLGETRDIGTDGTRKAFQRGMKGLIARKIISVNGLYAWIW